MVSGPEGVTVKKSHEISVLLKDTDLKSPRCGLLDINITYLSQSLDATRLKKLDLSGNNLPHVVPVPLETLLEEASGTLQHLDLNHCRLKDAHLSAVLPTPWDQVLPRPPGHLQQPHPKLAAMQMMQHLVVLKKPKIVKCPVECFESVDDHRWVNANGEVLVQVHTKLQEMLQTSWWSDGKLRTSVFLPV
ncbi:hypothetical protein HPG69_010692 [Diceros bicornis minor]|uniref:Leucine-rich repeat-containing protein 14 n=1 Tax=Diceros bicornis minor TaxID=77932 RepID=A0A7J7F0E2_DICBM|nr:hypothetical protein HPG69_010692 [Diceros bicornis minor]